MLADHWAITGTASTSLPYLEPGKAAHGGARLGEQLLDRFLLVTHRWLLGQHHVLEERVEPTVNDLRYGLLRLALIVSHLLGDAAFVGDDVGGHPVLGVVLRGHGGPLVRVLLLDLRS